jgi:hypothetical protein
MLTAEIAPLFKFGTFIEVFEDVRRFFNLFDNSAAPRKNSTVLKSP